MVRGTTRALLIDLITRWYDAQLYIPEFCIGSTGIGASSITWLQKRCQRVGSKAVWPVFFRMHFSHAFFMQPRLLQRLFYMQQRLYMQLQRSNRQNGGGARRRAAAIDPR